MHSLKFFRLEPDIPSRRGHKSKLKADLERLRESYTNIFHENMLENYSLNRPLHFARVSVYEEATKYEKVSTKHFLMKKL